jgi:iron complex outermembrane recepter protein
MRCYRMLLTSWCRPCGVAGACAMLLTGQALAQALEPVLVTAQKRTEEASAVPAALTVLQGRSLGESGVDTLNALGERVPNLQVDPGLGPQITLRGITSPDATEKGDPSVAYHLDGVYLARPQAVQGGFFDLERIEVLRGPQGTLYGRNATGGVINVLSARPKARLGAAAKLGVGDHGERRVEGMVNVPVDASLALRLALLRRERDTARHSSVPGPWSPGGDIDEHAWRGQVQWAPLVGWRLLVAADQSRDRGRAATRVPLTRFFDLSNPAAPVYVNRGAAAQTDVGVPGLFEPTQVLYQQGTRAELVVPLSWLDDAELTYLAAHRYLQRDSDGTQPLQLPGGAAMPVRVRQAGAYSQTQHEARLSSPAGAAVQWLAGVFAFAEDSHNQFYSYNLPVVPTPVYGWDIARTQAHSKAAFGQVRWPVRAQTHLEVGLRHTRDDKSRVGDVVFQQTEAFDPLVDMRLRDEAATRGSRTNGRVALDQTWLAQADRPLHGWLAYATGYKSGAFNDGCEAGRPGCLLPTPASLLYYRPETVQSLEAGVKGRWVPQRLSWQASVFGYRYRDLQLNTIVNTSQFTRNAARASVRGAELEGQWGVTAADRLDLQLAWLDAHYVDFEPVPGISWAGQALDRAPRSRIRLEYQRVQALPGLGRIEGAVGVLRSAGYVFSDPQGPVQFRQPGFYKWHARLSWASADERWRASLWGRNLNNRIVITDYHPLGNVAVADGRRWGLQVEARY